MEKYGKIDSKAKALDYAIRDCELKCNNLKYGYETKEKRIYTNYLSNDSWNSFLEKMCSLHQGQYKDADGGELQEKKGRYGIYPPKMASFGSSSRFIYRLSKDIDGFCFEKLLPTYVGPRPANLDGYCASKGRDVFVEAKCREIYASHKNNKIRNVYLDVYDYIKKVHPDFCYDAKEKDDDYSSITFYYDKKCIEHFDIKQLICHFLGICANILENNANRNVSFVYLIFNPQETTDFSNPKIQKFRDKIDKDYKDTISEINSLGDMKWLFKAVMGYQCKKLGKKNNVDYDFSFFLADQTNYRKFF